MAALLHVVLSFHNSQLQKVRGKNTPLFSSAERFSPPHLFE